MDSSTTQNPCFGNDIIRDLYDKIAQYMSILWHNHTFIDITMIMLYHTFVRDIIFIYIYIDMTYDQPNLDTVANKENVFLVAVCTPIWLCRMDWMGETRYSMDLSHTKGPSIRRASASIHHVIWLNYNNSLTITNLKIVVTPPLAVIPLAIIPVTSRRQIIVPSFAGHSSISMFIFEIWICQLPHSIAA